MKKLVCLFFCVSLFLSCSNNKKEVVIPSDVLSIEKMADILVEFQLIEAAVNLNIANYDPHLIPGSIPINTPVFKNNKMAKEIYSRSFDFYTKHPPLLIEIYKLVLNNLSKMQAAVNSEKDSVTIKP
jgi:hypothetical protein